MQITTDRPLTPNFRLFELTGTTLDKYQDQNRDLTADQIDKLTQVARLLEHVRYVLAEPLVIHSGYRCPDLNQAIGGSPVSQHLLCEAADFMPITMDLGQAFRIIQKDLTTNRSNVGQLIFETADRPYGVTSWIHISLGMPYREQARCNQVLRMENGVYTRIA